MTSYDDKYQQLLEIAKKHAKVKLYNTKTLPRSGPGADGSVPDLYEKAVPTIQLSVPQLKSSGEWLTTLAHELGHVTAKNKFKHRLGDLLYAFQRKYIHPSEALANAANWIHAHVPLIGKPVAKYTWNGGRALMESAAGEEALEHLKEVGVPKKTIDEVKGYNDWYVNAILDNKA